jgi:iron-sulfur cluster assembly accessory protein
MSVDGVKSFDATAPLTVTAAAAEHFRQRLAGIGKGAIRISVQESGCTGFKYVMEEVDGGGDSDTELELGNGISLYLDPHAVDFMRGTEIDYTREGINRTLKFRNPNVVAECGCGESFSVG